MALDLGDLLQKYLNPGTGQPSKDAEQHFDQIAQQASPDVMRQGIADALRSDQTPPLGQMVRDIFSKASPQEQAGMLNQILGSVSPEVLASLGAGALGGGAGQLGANTQLTPQQASKISPQQVQDLANRAEKDSPDIFDKLAGFYAEHPDLVKTLGSAALAIALAKVANRMRS